MAKVSKIMPAIKSATATLIVLDDATKIGSFLLAKVSKIVSLSPAFLRALSHLTSPM